MQGDKFGVVNIKLTQLIENKKISKNKLTNLSQMQRTQLNNYCKGDIQRVDLIILARLCYALGCTVDDILEYIPPQS